MILAYMTVALAGLVFGMVVNWLADQLPLISARAAEDDTPTDSKLPRLTSLHFPLCVYCLTRRPLRHYSGILAWLTSDPRCPNCRRQIALRYPLVEVFCILVSTYLFSRYGLESRFLLQVFYILLFTLITVIDFEHRYVLNIVMIPAFIISLIEVAVGARITLREALVGYAVGQLVVMGIYLAGAGYLWLVNRKRDQPIEEIAFGFGDVTLATYCGLVVGYPDVVYMLILMVFAGGAIAILYAGYRLAVYRKLEAHQPIAYGPAIVLAASALLIWHDQILQILYGAR